MAIGQLAFATLMGVFLLLVAGFALRARHWRSGPRPDGEAPASRHKPPGLARWLTTVDHKDIGVMYALFAVVAFVWGGLAVLLMRLELLVPDTAVIEPTFYNALLTSHGITMLFLFGTPVIAAFGNYLVPLLVGADDMAFPRVNAIAFWILPPAAVLVWAGFFLAPLGLVPGASQTSWTMYTPLSAGVGQDAVGGASVDLMLLGLHLSGVSATMGAINFIATIVAERGDDVGWERLDIFSWTMLTQSGLILFAFPLLGSAIVMLLLDRNLGTSFFAVEGGGPMLWQHLFWFFGHPEVYILVLPPMGLVSLILPRFAGRHLFGFKFVVYSTLAIGVLSFGVWAHHMFTTGMDPRLRASFMAVSMAIAVPSAVKTFNWITTMWNGRVRLTAPMLFCVGFVSNFIVGGVTGVFLASIPVDLILHDTYYVVGHFHFIVMGAIAFAGFGAIYYWYPLVVGRMYQRTLARWHFVLWMLGSNLTFIAMILLGYGGHPRRYATYAFGPAAPMELFVGLHQVATLGAVLMFLGGGLFVWNVVVSAIEGPLVTDGDPWDLARDGLLSREWQWFREQQRAGGTPTPYGRGDAVATDGGERIGGSRPSPGGGPDGGAPTEPDRED